MPESIKIEKFVQEEYKGTLDYQEVEEIGNKLLQYLRRAEVKKRIDDANAPKKNSKEVQEVFLKYATEELGFKDEKRGLFSEYKTSALRPDYFRKTKSSGIILEVERGKTLMNNMDLLDLWKCHICTEANSLFLMVPQNLSHQKGSSYKAFNKVCERMSTFYEKDNYTNVLALFIYGY